MLRITVLYWNVTSLYRQNSFQFTSKQNSCWSCSFHAFTVYPIISSLFYQSWAYVFAAVFMVCNDRWTGRTTWQSWKYCKKWRGQSYQYMRYCASARELDKKRKPKTTPWSREKEFPAFQRALTPWFYGFWLRKDVEVPSSFDIVVLFYLSRKRYVWC